VRSRSGDLRETDHRCGRPFTVMVAKVGSVPYVGGSRPPRGPRVEASPSPGLALPGRWTLDRVGAGEVHPRRWPSVASGPLKWAFALFGVVGQARPRSVFSSGHVCSRSCTCRRRPAHPVRGQGVCPSRSRARLPMWERWVVDRGRSRRGAEPDLVRLVAPPPGRRSGWSGSTPACRPARRPRCRTDVSSVRRGREEGDGFVGQSGPRTDSRVCFSGGGRCCS